MGGVVSAPLTFASTLAANVATGCLGQLGLCIGAAAGSSPFVSRLVYVLHLLLWSGLACLAWQPNVYAHLHAWLPAKVSGSDAEDGAQCYFCRSMAVHRIGLAMFLLHALHSVAMLNARTTADKRLGIYNGFWLLRLLLVVGIVVGLFFATASALDPYARYVATPLAALFLLTQCVLVIGFAHSSAERALKWHEERDGSTALSGAVLFAWTILAYGGGVLGVSIWLLAAGIGSTTIVSLNLCFAVIAGVLSVTPCVQGKNRHSGLLQASLVSLFATSLVASASWQTQHDAASTLGNVVLGLATTATMVFMASRGPSAIGSADEPGGAGDEDLGYSPAVFQALLALCSAYVAVLIADWRLSPAAVVENMSASVSASASAVPPGQHSEWIKTGMSWVIYVFYAWSLIGPVVLPDRDWGVEGDDF